MNLSARAAIPSLDRLLRDERAQPLQAEYGRAALRDALRLEAAALREHLAVAAPPSDPAATLLAAAARRLGRDRVPSLRRVYNLTGTVLHTNLGRATLPAVAVAAVAEAAAYPVNLEYDLDSGRRGERDTHIAETLCRLCGAEAATVVNNNAAALILILNTFALGRPVPVSRGELVEIGGAFRVPDIMTRAGCRLLEVGTTNRTHLRDFANALDDHDDVPLLLRVHTSNYEIHGFTAAVGEAELAAFAHQRGLPLVHDLGSGSLLDVTQFGLDPEPTPQAALRAGTDLVCFSGDKLLGGPQCGIVVGRRDLIAALNRNPLKRALRCDKLTLAALQTLLPLYADPARAAAQIPTLRLLSRPRADIAAAAERLRARLGAPLAGRAGLTAHDCRSQIGSGALPVARLHSAALVLTPQRGSLETLTQAFRQRPRPVLGRRHDGALWFDLRCLEPDEEDGFVANLDGF